MAWAQVDKSIVTDDQIVALAKQQSRIILTFDKDFGEIYYFHKKKNLTIIVLYLEDQTSESVNKVLEMFFKNRYMFKIKNKLVIVYKDRYRMIG